MIREDGFNNRKIYIMNANNQRFNNNATGNFDNSLAKMNSKRNDLVQTANSSNTLKPIEAVRGSRENFVIQNNHISNFGKKVPSNNYVSRALDNSRFKKAS